MGKMNHRRWFGWNHPRIMNNFQPNLFAWFFEFGYMLHYWTVLIVQMIMLIDGSTIFLVFLFSPLRYIVSLTLAHAGHIDSPSLSVSVEIMTIDKCFDVSFYTAFRFDWLILRIFRIWQYHSKRAHIRKQFAVAMECILNCIESLISF